MSGAIGSVVEKNDDVFGLDLAFFLEQGWGEVVVGLFSLMIKMVNDFGPVFCGGWGVFVAQGLVVCLDSFPVLISVHGKKSAS